MSGGLLPQAGRAGDLCAPMGKCFSRESRLCACSLRWRFKTRTAADSTVLYRTVLATAALTRESSNTVVCNCTGNGYVAGKSPPVAGLKRQGGFSVGRRVSPSRTRIEAWGGCPCES